MSLTDTNGFQLLTAEKLESLPDLEWLIPSILPKPSLAILYGDPGCGKTFAALSMSLSVASGADWLGRPCVATEVLYIAAEGVLGLKSRLAAHRSVRGPIGATIRFLPGAPNLLDSGDLEAMSDALKAADFRPGLIVVDTLARVTTGVDENNARDMGQAVAALDGLRTTYNATVLVLHHKTKSGGSERGSSALRGAADVMVECRAGESVQGPTIELECTKMKDDEPFKNIAGLLQRVELGDGRSSLIISHEVEPQDVVGPLAQGQIVDILSEEFAENGATNTELRKAFEARELGSKSTFDRGMRSLNKSGQVRIEGAGRGKRYFPIGPKTDQDQQ
jgi:RecA/RadA recombinase